MNWQHSLLLFCGWMFLWFALCAFGWKWLLRRNRNRMINMPPPNSACRRNSTEAVP